MLKRPGPLLAGALFVTLAAAAAAADLPRAIGDCVLIDDPCNTGVSIRVGTPDGVEFVLRLSLIESPGTSFEDEAAVRELRGRMAYFGLPSLADTLEFGREAAERTRELLQSPFSVYPEPATVSREADGGAERIYYGRVHTAGGRDLAEVLVACGLAGLSGMDPASADVDGLSDCRRGIRDLETAAAMARAGAWSRSSPARLAARLGGTIPEPDALEALRAEVLARDRPFDLNSAFADELEVLPGIGPVRARLIIEHAPHRYFEDLLAIEGIGPETVATLRKWTILPGDAGP